MSTTTRQQKPISDQLSEKFEDEDQELGRKVVLVTDPETGEKIQAVARVFPVMRQLPEDWRLTDRISLDWHVRGWVTG